MRILLFLKVSVLILALAGVMFAMRNLNADSMNRALLALGVEPGTAQSPGFQPGHRAAGKGEQRYNICPTRVHAVVWADGRKVEESKDGLKLKWMAHDPSPREINYLEVEKWLSRHCQIHIQAPSQEDQSRSAFHDFLAIRYIDGSELKITRAGEPAGDEDLFQIGDQLVRSVDLKEAAQELKQIAIFDKAP